MVTSSVGTLFDSLLWGFVASIPLIAGAVLASFINLKKPIIASIMAFGAGVLVAALTFSLIEEAYNLVNDIVPVVLGFALGGLSYSVVNHILNNKSGTKNRKRSHGENAGGGNDASGIALMIGSLMDNIPENMALGISIVAGGTVNVVLIAAIFISNFPEGLASSQGMKSNGKSTKQILLLWAVVVAIGTVASAIGFSVLANVNKDIVAIALSYASGAILVMLAESMIPEAFEEGGSKIGLATMAGFAVAFVLGRLGGG
ncbi:MAG: ZIP family zinc transporter [Thermoproteota archaeon]|jgi:zinc transporter, ZIP family|nr:ZIP family zinc transporter [Thermoproteota archaeon]